MFKSPTSFNEFFSNVHGVAISLALGLIITTCGLFVYSKYVTYTENVERIEQLDIVDIGRVHIFSPPMVPYRCIVLQTDSGVEWKETSTDGSGAAVCNKFMQSIHFWEKQKIVHNSNKLGTMIGGGLLSFIVYVCICVLVSIPVNLVAIVINNMKLLEYAPTITFILTLPILIYGMAFTYNSAYNPVIEGWRYSGGPAEVHRVYITRSGELYHAPENQFEWTELEIGSKLLKFK